MPCTQPIPSWLDELHKEAFSVLPGTVKTKCCAGMEHLSRVLQNIPVMGKALFEDELAEEVTWGLHDPHHVHFVMAKRRV